MDFYKANIHKLIRGDNFTNMHEPEDCMRMFFLQPWKIKVGSSYIKRI